MNYKRIFILFILVFFIGNLTGIFVPFIVNAAKYAQVSREILDHHNWINLTIGNTAYEQKPPLIFWIGAFFYSLFGVSTITFKVSVILISFSGIYFTFRLGKLLYGKKTGILAAIFWGSSLGYFHFHNDIHTDTLLATIVIISIYFFAVFLREKRNYQFLLGILFTGFAMLTKGPVGLAIPAFAIGTHLILKKEFREIFHLRWLVALLVLFIIIIPALWGLYEQFGFAGIKFFFWTNNMGRITGSYHGTNNDPFFYIHNSIYLIAPWTIFCFAGYYFQIKEKFNLKKWKEDNAEFFTLGGITLYVLILSIAKTKNPHYLMAVIPLMAIIGARWTIYFYEEKPSSGFRKLASVFNIVLVVVLWLIILLFGIYIFPETHWWIWVIVFAMFSGIIMSRMLKTSILGKEIIMLLLTIGSLVSFLNSSILPSMLKYHSPYEAAETFNEYAAAGEKIYIFKPKARYWEIFYYSKSYGKYLITANDFLNENLKSGDWIYTEDTGIKDLNSLNIEYELVKTFPHRSITGQSIKFLNPKTRQQKIQKRYLVQLK